MQYTAIVKNGGLFIPNIFTQVENNDNQPLVVQVDLDIAQLYKQLQSTEQPTQNMNDTSVPVQKINLANLPIKAFDNIDDPVAWQDKQREEW